MGEVAQPAHTARRFDRARLSRLADALAVAVAASLPWSTSATSIFLVAWLLALIPTLDIAAVRREVLSAAGGLPVLLWLLALIGMGWADAPIAERLGGLQSFHRFLAIPLLFAQFRATDRGNFVLVGFVASATALLVASFVHAALWQANIFRSGYFPGIPVRDYISQSGIFVICVFALLGVAAEFWRAGRRGRSLLLIALALIFLANVVYLATGRTALVVVPVLIALFGLRQFGWRGMLGALAAAAVLVAVTWASSAYLRARVERVLWEIQIYRADNIASSTGLRLEFWKKSLEFVAEAPIIGHGTGSINELFRHSAVGEAGASAVAAHNPHQQIFAVAIQLGVIGAALLLGMWIAHLAMFSGAGPTAWFGLVIVVQNIVSSMFNSHLFDFTQGWLYVLAVGVIGGMVLREQDRSRLVATRPGT